MKYQALCFGTGFGPKTSTCGFHVQSDDFDDYWRCLKAHADKAHAHESYCYTHGKESVEYNLAELNKAQD